MSLPSFPHEQVRLAKQSAENAQRPYDPADYAPVIRRVTTAEKISAAAVRAGKAPDYDPLDVMADAMMDETVNRMDRVAIADKLMPYLYGKQPKAVPLDIPDDTPATSDEAWERIKDRMDNLAAQKSKKYLIATGELVEDAEYQDLNRPEGSEGD